MRCLSKEESHRLRRETFSALERGSFFTEQVGTTDLQRVLVCLDPVYPECDDVLVAEVSSVAFFKWMTKTWADEIDGPLDLPAFTYRFDPEKCINLLSTADVDDPSAQPKPFPEQH